MKEKILEGKRRDGSFGGICTLHNYDDIIVKKTRLEIKKTLFGKTFQECC
jgi:hypothetical protein